MTSIQVYGTSWCRSTFRVREYLTNAGVDYDYVDIERDAGAAAFVRATNGGRQRFPVVVVEGRTVTNPVAAELRTLLHDHCVEPRRGGGANRPQSADL